MSDRIKLFVGTSPNGEDAEARMVLEYSARKNSSLPVDIVWMKHTNDESSFWYGWDGTTWATPFSGHRWGIPEACNFEGKAIYVDHDFIFLSDLAELWNQEFRSGKIAMVKGGQEGWRTCIMLWNCEEAKKYLPPVSEIKSEPTSHRQLIGWLTNSNLIQTFEGNWNTVDGEHLSIEEIDGYHYSSMNHQHHIKYALPRLESKGRKHWFDGEIMKHWRQDLEDLFDQYYQEALAVGYKVEDYDCSDNDLVSYEKESLKQYGQRKVHSWVK